MTILFNIIYDIALFAWDASLTMINVITPKKKQGYVVPEGCPGFGGKWPEYVAPNKNDSRCSCPALTTLANHGILPRDGKNIQFKDKSYEIPRMLGKDYNQDTISLSELDLHNGIEHDASLFREDTDINPNQGSPHVELITSFLSSASGKDQQTGEPILTSKDISKFSFDRRIQAQTLNKNFKLDFIHKIFGSTNASTLLAIFDGRVNDLKIWLLEERFPDGWESRLRHRVGLTFMEFNMTVLCVEYGIGKQGKRERENVVG